MPTTVRSHAKINLGLYIGAPRDDGFHSLCTVYQTLELHDQVTVSAQPASTTSIRLTSNNQLVPTDIRNTAWKMVDLALQGLGINADVVIHIEKRLPIQGGLGAGSANAVAALIGLESELTHHDLGAPEPALSLWKGLPSETWDTRPSAPSIGRLSGAPSDRSSSLGWLTDGWETTNWPTHRLALASQVGSDVPLFLIGGAILGLDRGQEVYPLPDLDSTWCVIATPAIGVSTPQAFRDWDALCAAEGLTHKASTDKLKQLSRAYASAFAGAIPSGRQEAGSSGVPTSGRDLAGPQESALVRTGITSWIENDFERVVFPQHPSLAEIKRLLAGPGTPEAASSSWSLLASLSGSGSALFGLYLTQEDARAAQNRLTSAGVPSQITRTLPRSEYWEKMLVQQG